MNWTGNMNTKSIAINDVVKCYDFGSRTNYYVGKVTATTQSAFQATVVKRVVDGRAVKCNERTFIALKPREYGEFEINEFERVVVVA